MINLDFEKDRKNYYDAQTGKSIYESDYIQVVSEFRELADRCQEEIDKVFIPNHIEFKSKDNDCNYLKDICYPEDIVDKKYFKTDEDVQFFKSFVQEIISDNNLTLITRSFYALAYILFTMGYEKYLENPDTYRVFNMRPHQVMLMEVLCNILVGKQDGLLQAGTGVGKSFAYIIPVVLCDRKCIISTSTKQLTRQLVDKDLPTVKKYLFHDLEFTGLQSMGNFICFKRYAEILEEYNDDPKDFTRSRPEDLKALKAIKPLLEQYRRNEIKYDKFVIDNIKGCDTTDFRCAGGMCAVNCKFKGKEECPVYKIYRQVQQSNIVVSNHAHIANMLVNLTKNHKSKMSLLQNRNLWICDEAHDLGHYVEGAFSSELSLNAVDKFLRINLQKYVDSKVLYDNYTEKADVYLDNDLSSSYLIRSRDELRAELMSFASILRTLISVMNKYKNRAAFDLEEDGKNTKYKQDNPLYIDHDDMKILSKISSGLADFINKIDIMNNKIAVKYIPSILKMARDVQTMLVRVLKASDRNDLYFLKYEYKSGDNIMPEYYNWQCVYLKTGHAIQAALGYAKPDNDIEDEDSATKYIDTLQINEYKINLIGLSATVALGQPVDAFGNQKLDFKHIGDALGLTELNDTSCILYDAGTVFNYPEQVLMYIPQDIPNIVKGNYKNHDDFFREDVIKLIEAVDGGALILCTSNSETEFMYGFLNKRIGYKYNIYSYSEGAWKDRSELIEAFKRDENSILIGTKGFFQGLDVPGISLRLVVLNKLPVPIPDALSRRRTELIDEEIAKNPVNGVSSAYTRLFTKPATADTIQAVGRLIRQQTDKGILAIYDDRLFNSSWGKQVYGSLPYYAKTYNLNDVKAYIEDYKLNPLKNTEWIAEWNRSRE